MPAKPAPKPTPTSDLLTQQARHVKYPRPLQWLTFNTYFRQVRDEYATVFRQQADEARRHGVVQPRLPSALQTRMEDEFLLADDFARASIYYVTRPVAQVMLDTGQRLSDAAPYQPLLMPEPPITPLWVEFAPDATVGDEQMVIRGLLFRAIEGFAFMDPAVDVLDPSRGPQRAVEMTLFDDNVSWKTFRYGTGANGVWALQQTGPCDSAQTCPIARRTRSGVNFDVHQVFDLATVFPERGKPCVCPCYDAGAAWAVIVYALLNLINAEGIAHTSVQHEARLDSDHLPNHVKREAQRAMTEWNGAFAMRYKELSISARLHRVRVARTPGRPTDAQLVDTGAPYPDYAIDNATGQKIAVGVPTHWRLLIPGPGKPWRGDRPRIIPVRSFTYERVAGRRTRSKTVRLITP